MKYQPKFKQPINKEEKLICELTKMLHDITIAYIKLNRESCSDLEIFITIRDGALAYAGQTLDALLKIMEPINEQQLSFLKESQEIFNKYIEQSLESIK